MRPDGTYGDTLRACRRRARWTLRQLADAVGLSEAQVSRVETGARPPLDERRTARAARLLGTSRWPLYIAAVRQAGWPEAADALAILAGDGGAGDGAEDDDGQDEGGCSMAPSSNPRRTEGR